MNSIKARLADERGFTLIELLVVMIIIGILMSVAVPVFLGQKQKALATNAKTNATSVMQTIASCGASTTNGTLYDAGPPAFNCTTPAAITAAEPSLTKLVTGTNCGGVLCVTINTPASAANPSDYVLTSVTNSDSANRTPFRITVTDADIVKTCGTAAGGTAAASQKTCPTGKW